MILPQISKSRRCAKTTILFNIIIADRLQQITNYEQVAEEYEKILTGDRQEKYIVPEKYSAHRDSFLQLLSSFENMSDGLLDRIKTGRNRIELTSNDTSLAHSNAYCAGPRARQFVEIAYKMLKDRFIELANIESTIRIIFEPKKEGSLRLYVNYHRTRCGNSEQFRSPVKDGRVDPFRGRSHNLLMLDASSGYYRTETDRRNRWKTAFTRHDGLLQTMHIPHGLKNAVATFQRLMDVILSSVRWRSMLIHFYDNVVFFKNTNNHKPSFRKILT